MKRTLCIFAILCSSATWAAEPPSAADASVIKGEILETRNAGSYTYLRLKTTNGETWAAVPRAPLNPGEPVTIEDAAVMADFESKTLGKTFERIVFGVLRTGGRGAPVAMALPEHAAGDVRVNKASGPAGYTVAEIVTQSEDLKDQTVVVRGKVVKYNEAVMGKNWIHLRDGSGSASSRSNDVLVTSTDQAKLGDIVTVKGIVRTNKDFGAGYAYKVLVEDASLHSGTN